MIVTADNPVPREVVDGIVAGDGFTPAARSSSRRLSQPATQVLDEVLGGLDAAREPHEVGRHGRRRVLDGLVGHRLRHLDQRLDAAERLRQREDSVRAAIRVASGWRNETIPPKPGQRTSSTPGRAAQELADRAAVLGVRRHPQVERAQPAVDEEAVERARARRRPSSARSARARGGPRRATTTAPPTTSECPPRYLVVECTTASAPSSSGRWTTGVANVLSTATSAPCLRSTTAAMSTTFSSGLVGVSTQISRVSGAHRRARARRGRSGRPCRTRARSA